MQASPTCQWINTILFDLFRQGIRLFQKTSKILVLQILIKNISFSNIDLQLIEKIYHLMY